MYSEPLLLLQEELYFTGVAHLLLSWCREALVKMSPHSSDELVALHCASQLALVAAGPAPSLPASLCFAIYTSAGSESRRAGGSERIGGFRAAACVFVFCLTGWAGYYCKIDRAAS